MRIGAFVENSRGGGDVAAGPGRLTLGIGLSHQVVVEGMWGHSFDRPARRMDEYLDALLPLVRERKANVERETVEAMARSASPRQRPFPS